MINEDDLPPVIPRGVHHIALSVPSLDTAIAFYHRAFGFSVVDRERLAPSAEGDRVSQLDNADCTTAMLAAGNIFIELFEFHAPTPKSVEHRMCDYGYTHLSLEVDDVYEAYEQLSQHGISCHSTPIDAGDGYLMTYGRDPFGNVIEIQQVPDGRAYAFSQLPGR